MFEFSSYLYTYKCAISSTTLSRIRSMSYVYNDNPALVQWSSHMTSWTTTVTSSASSTLCDSVRERVHNEFNLRRWQCKFRDNKKFKGFFIFSLPIMLMKFESSIFVSSSLFQNLLQHEMCDTTFDLRCSMLGNTSHVNLK